MTDDAIPISAKHNEALHNALMASSTPAASSDERDGALEVVDVDQPPATITFNPVYGVTYVGSDPMRGYVYYIDAALAAMLAYADERVAAALRGREAHPNPE